MPFPRPALALTATVAAALLTACATPAPQPLEAVVELHGMQQAPQADSNTPSITGELRFKQWQDEVVINGTVENLPLRDGRQLRGNALHIHETGDCSAPDGSSAGGIFNPTHKQHSWPGSGMVGDLPMLMPNEKGEATISNYLSPLIKLDGPNSVIGKAVIVHRDIDDWAVQPDGRAGPAIACGVIRVVKPGQK